MSRVNRIVAWLAANETEFCQVEIWRAQRVGARRTARFWRRVAAVVQP